MSTHVDVLVSGAIGLLTDYTLRPVPFDNNWQKFRLIQQSDGSYALQTSNGINYVTAFGEEVSRPARCLTTTL